MFAINVWNVESPSVLIIEHKMHALMYQAIMECAPKVRCAANSKANRVGIPRQCRQTQKTCCKSTRNNASMIEELWVAAGLGSHDGCQFRDAAKSHVGLAAPVNAHRETPQRQAKR